MRASLIKECCSAPTAPVTADWLREHSALPCLVLQCQDAFVDRVESYLQLKYGAACAAKICHPSLTELASTAERHVLVYAEVAKTHAELQNDLLGDANLTGAIHRIYRFDGAHAQAFATTHELAAWAASPDRQLGGGSVRLQVFPPFLKRLLLGHLGALSSEEIAGNIEEMVGRISPSIKSHGEESESTRAHAREGDQRTLTLDPTAGADWVLSVVLADGCILVCIMCC
jgi:hypothetical protein